MGDLGNTVSDALFQVHELLFGDVLTSVDIEGNHKSFNCLMEDFVRVSADSMVIDQAGIRDIEVRTVIAHNTHLEAQGINLDATLYFLDADGKRWDYSEEDMIARAIVPIDGSQCMTQFRMRKSEEVNRTDADTGFTWE